MIIGLDGSRAFLKYRTGIEEYSYQVIKHLRVALPQEVIVRVYVRKKIAFENGKLVWKFPVIDFSLPENWQLVGLWAPRFWTQIRLSLEMFMCPVDALFIPAHTVPVIHPRKTFVTVHGLEYEMSPKSYSFWERFYMRVSIEYSIKVAKKIIVVSENTKHDLVRLYRVLEQKILVVYEGYENNTHYNNTQHPTPNKPYFLCIGRLEERKNNIRIIQAFERVKTANSIPHQLILVGKPGLGYQKITNTLENSSWKKDILELGYVSSEAKQSLLQSAQAFIFPSLYEGFGLPILEAQAAGIPVITSNNSSLPEVAGDSALFVNPENVSDMVEKLESVLNFSKEERQALIEKGYKNLERFSWKKCAEEIAETLLAA